MDKFTISQNTVAAIAEAKAKADKQAQETPSEKFERGFKELIQDEINLAVGAAENFKCLIHGAPAYTYTHTFPVAIFEALSEETLVLLEQHDIYLTKNNELGNASIRIIIHF